MTKIITAVSSLKVSALAALVTIPFEMEYVLRFIIPIASGFVWWLIKRWLDKKYNNG